MRLYRIRGNFGGGFNLAIWRLKSLSPNFKYIQLSRSAWCTRMKFAKIQNHQIIYVADSDHFAKFNACQNFHNCNKVCLIIIEKNNSHVIMTVLLPAKPTNSSQLTILAFCLTFRPYLYWWVYLYTSTQKMMPLQQSQLADLCTHRRQSFLSSICQYFGQCSINGMVLIISYIYK